MKVSEVIALAKGWVSAEASQAPGFLAAHLGGSLSSLPQQATFPLYRDLDVYIISQAEKDRHIRPYLYKGLMVDAQFSSPKYYQSPELILANPHLAYHIAADTILSDPTGMLQALHQAVKKEYSQRQWVTARIEYEKQELILPALEAPKFNALVLYLVIVNLGGLIAVADLKNPTHRRSLILLKEMLQARDDTTLHDQALQLLGSAGMSRDQVSSYIPHIQEAFRRAVTVYQTPIPYVGHKLRPDREPYFIAASQEMIDEGHHREAMLWMLGALHLANTALQNDAPAPEKRAFQARYDSLLQDLGLSKPDDWQQRQQRLRRLVAHFFNLADKIVASHPMIRD